MPADAPGHYLIATIGGARRRRHRIAGVRRRGWSRGAPTSPSTTPTRRPRPSRRRAAPSPSRPSTPGRADGWPRAPIPRGAEFRLWQARERLGAQLVERAGDVELQRPAHLRSARGRDSSTHAVFGWEVDDVGFADDDPQARLRRSPRRDRRPRHQGAPVRRVAPPGFEDAVAWMGIIPEGHAEHWQVTFHRRGPRRVRGHRRGARRHRRSPPRTPSGRRRRPSAIPQGAEFVLSQFTPPKG